MLRPFPRQYHMPRLGAIVHVATRPLQPGHRWRRFRVDSFPLARGWRHLVHLRALDNGQRCTVSGFFCQED